MRISVASINLHCGLTRHGRPYPVADAIGALDADVVLVQENWRPRGEESLGRRAAAALGYRGAAELDLVGDVPMDDLRIVRGPTPGETGAAGLALLSRVAWQGYSTIPLRLAAGDLCGSRSPPVFEIPRSRDWVLGPANPYL